MPYNEKLGRKRPNSLTMWAEDVIDQPDKYSDELLDRALNEDVRYMQPSLMRATKVKFFEDAIGAQIVANRQPEDEYLREVASITSLLAAKFARDIKIKSLTQSYKKVQAAEFDRQLVEVMLNGADGSAEDASIAWNHNNQSLLVSPLEFKAAVNLYVESGYDAESAELILSTEALRNLPAINIPKVVRNLGAGTLAASMMTGMASPAYGDELAAASGGESVTVQTSGEVDIDSIFGPVEDTQPEEPDVVEAESATPDVDKFFGPSEEEIPDDEFEQKLNQIFGIDETEEIEDVELPENGNTMPVVPDQPEGEPSSEPIGELEPGEESKIKLEIDAIIDGLNLQPYQKDFLREVSYGAIGLVRDGAPVNSEVMIAQAMLESGWNGSELSKNYRNIFGVKAGSSWAGETVVMNTREEVNGESIYVDAVWRAYPTYGEAINDYAHNFIGGLEHYQDAVQFRNDPAKYLDGLLNQLDENGNIVIAQNQPGSMSYATDSAYKTKILSTIEANKIYDIVSVIKSELNGSSETRSQTIVDSAPKTETPERVAEPAENIKFGYSIDQFGGLNNFNQCGGDWGNKTVPDGRTYCDTTCGSSGLAAYLYAAGGDKHKNLDAGDVSDKAATLDLFNEAGIGWDGMVKLAGEYGVAASHHQVAAGNMLSYDQIVAQLETGGTVMLAGQGGLPYVDSSIGAHFILVRAVTENGNFLIYDTYPKLDNKTLQADPDAKANVVEWDPNHLINSSFGAIAFDKPT